MINKNVFIGFILCLTIAGKLKAQQTPLEIRFDPKNVYGTTASSIFEDIKFIPLETTSASLFGQIVKLEISDDFFFIYDRDTDAILVFSKSGKYHCKINKLPGVSREIIPGRNTPLLIRDFAVNLDDHEIVVSSSYDGKNVYCFNFDGSFKHKREFALRYPTMTYLKNGIYVVQNVRPTVLNKLPINDVFPYRIFYVDKSGNIINKELPIDFNPLSNTSEQYSDYRNFYHQGQEGIVFYTKSYDYKIYELSATAIAEKYKFVFPIQYSLPDAFETDPIYLDKRIRYVMDHPETFLGIRGAYQIKNQLAVNFDIATSLVFHNVIFNLKTLQPISIKKITPDVLTDDLPIFSSDPNIIASDGDSFYISLSSLTLFSKYLRDKKYSPVLANYFQKESKKSNPVIIQLNPKNN